MRINLDMMNILAKLVGHFEQFKRMGMIRYAVMWKFKPSDGRSPKEIGEDVKEKYQSLMGLVPGLKNIEVGINRNESATAYDAMMIADFESWEALAAYKADSMRDDVVKYVETLIDVRARVEYER